VPAAASLKSRLPEIIALVDVRSSAYAKALAEEIAERARDRAPDAPPLGTGLVSSIHVEELDEDTFSVQAGDDDVFYGHMVEYGTSHSAPVPFLIPAFEEAAEAAGRVSFNL
jgi:HK97 gp10 family phage protein